MPALRPTSDGPVPYRSLVTRLDDEPPPAPKPPSESTVTRLRDALPQSAGGQHGDQITLSPLENYRRITNAGGAGDNAIAFTPRQPFNDLASQEVGAEQGRIDSYLRNEVGQTRRPTPEQVRFGQGIVNTMDEYQRAPAWNAATKRPQLMDAYRNNVVYPVGAGEESFYQPGYIQTDAQAARHELTHGVYYEQMSPEQRADFLRTVFDVAKTDSFVAEVVAGRAQNAPGAGVDPQHIYTYFDELNPNRVPVALRKFYDAGYLTDKASTPTQPAPDSPMAYGFATDQEARIALQMPRDQDEFQRASEYIARQPTESWRETGRDASQLVERVTQPVVSGTNALAKGIDKVPINTTMLGTGGSIGGVGTGGSIDTTKPVAEQGPLVRFGAQAAPYIGASVATGGVADVAFTAQALAYAANAASRYEQGEISGREALLEIALNAGPEALAPVLRAGGAGVRALVDYAQTPEGKAALDRIPALARNADEALTARTGEGLSGESGMVRLGGEVPSGGIDPQSITPKSAGQRLETGNVIPDQVDAMIARALQDENGIARLRAYVAADEKYVAEFGPHTDPNLASEAAKARAALDNIPASETAGTSLPSQSGREAPPVLQESASPSPPAAQDATPPEALAPVEPLQRPQEAPSAAEGMGGGEPPRTPDTAVAAPEPDGKPPVGGDVLAPVIERVVRDLQGAALTTSERKKIVRAGRQRQAAKLGPAIEGEGSTVERALAARGAEKGKIIPGIKPIGEKYTAGEVDEVYRTIDQAYQSGAINRFEYPNATSALNLLFHGERLPTPSDARLPLHLMPSEIKLLGRVFGPEFEAALPTSAAELSFFQRAVDIANIPRSLQTMLDLSASLRQGGMLAIRNPAEWKRAFNRQITAMNSEEAFSEIIEEIRRMPSYESGQRSGLRIVGTAGDANAEEAFLSTTAERLPGIGRFVKGSERGYNAFLNYLRQSVFDKKYGEFTAKVSSGKWTQERADDALEQWATFVNHATGQGDVGMLREYVPAMNALLFSPKYVISRPQSVWDLVKPGVDPAVRKATAENLATFFGGGMLLLAAAQMSGLGEVSLDPRSSDFAKVRVGNTRFDFWSGFQPLVRYATQISTGERSELFTGDVAKVNRGKTIGRFLRSKLSPMGALGWDIVIEGGKDYEGKNLDPRSPLSVGERALRSVTPLFVQNLYDAFSDGGLKTLALTAAPSALGVGTGTYGPSDEVKQEITRDTFAGDVLKPAGASIRDGAVVLDSWEENWSRDGAYIASELGLEPTESRTELRQAFIDQWVSEYLADFPALGEKQARTDIGNLFDKQDAVSSYDTARKRARLEFWKAHPDILERAVGLGLETLNEDERRILQGVSPEP